VTPKEVLDAYQTGCTAETLRRQKVDISLFEQSLLSNNIQVSQMFDDLTKWEIVSADLLEQFIKWLFEKGYALGSIKVRVATIKAYSRLAGHAGILSADELHRINKIRGFYGQEPSTPDNMRARTRIGIKKEEAVPISFEQATLLKKPSGDKLQDQRDALLMCLLLDHGLRITELAHLRVDAINRGEGTLTFSKSKSGKEEEHIHHLSEETLQALERYLTRVFPKELLLCSFHRNDKQIREGMSGRAINERVRLQGERVGLKRLAPEDCRRYWDAITRPLS
jgi:integrase